MIKFAVVDDEHSIATETESCLAKVCEELQIASEIDVFFSGEEVTRFLKSDNVYHMIFLDIEMGEYSGIDVSRYIRDTLQDEATQIVYISGKNGYDRQLFEFRPFHFLAKPVDEDKIHEVLSKYVRIYGKKQELFEYKSGHGTYWEKLSDILYFESDDRKVKMKTVTGEKAFYGSVKKILEQVEKRGFFVPHKSFVVNYRFVKSFHPEFLMLVNHDRIPIAKGKRKEIARLQLMLENGGRWGEG